MLDVDADVRALLAEDPQRRVLSEESLDELVEFSVAYFRRPALDRLVLTRGTREQGSPSVSA